MREQLTLLQYQAMRRHILKQIFHDEDCEFLKNDFENECTCDNRNHPYCQMLAAKPESLDKDLYDIFLSK